ncbi:MAG: hypothetical protein M3N82_00950 [Pseudomonadota bacterium]|nr:hypothetical protein [Pseudomonadota bacterium]
MLEALQATPWATRIAESDLLFPTIETVHVLALAVVIGSISIVDLRLLGRSSHRGVMELSEEVLPWTWIAFVVTVISGCLMFSSAAVKYAYMVQFQVKMLLILLAGINMLLFHFLTYRSVAKWNHDSITPPSARFAGLLSLVFWISVVTLGRWVGFV